MLRIVPVLKVGIVVKMYPLQLYHTQVGKAKNEIQMFCGKKNSSGVRAKPLTKYFEVNDFIT